MAAVPAATKEQRILVRYLIANLLIRKPEGDQLKLRVALCKKFYDEFPQLEATHLLRTYEALCNVDFPDETSLALRDFLARSCGRLLKLKLVRDVVIERPAKPGPAPYSKATCPHN